MKLDKLLLYTIFFILFVLLFGTLLTKYFDATDKATIEPEIEIISNRTISRGDIILNLSLISDDRIIATAMTCCKLLIFNEKAKLWNSINVADWRINAVNFTDSQKGFAVGNYGTILQTSDEGGSWIQLPRFSDVNLKRVKFVSSSIGFISGDLGVIDKRSGTLTYKVEIWRTDDGGETWKRYYVDEESENSVFNMAVLSQNVVLISMAKEFLRTDDGGANWQTTESEKSISSIFAHNGVIWLVNEEGDFNFSIDNGLTWKVPTTLPTEFSKHNWKAISLGKNKNGLAVSGDGTIAYSVDNGENWKILKQKLNDVLLKVEIFDNVGVILGENNIYKITINLK